MEPRAKEILRLAGVEVPLYCWAKNQDEALEFAAKQGYPLAMKVVSPQVLHKTDAGGVVVGIDSREGLLAAFAHMRLIPGFAGVHLEEMCQGIELIIGAKIDYQFGPVLLLGLGGVSVEIYKDTVIRMAPLEKNEVEAMVHSLKAHELLQGFRGAAAINMEALGTLMTTFSKLVVDLSAEIESIDLNPVFCNEKRCVVADARIILASGNS
jgi:succinyl-CoA synthetase beta subunit